jgi:hypothetical protein
MTRQARGAMRTAGWWLVAALALLPAACRTLPDVATVGATPAEYAWWLRTTFQPRGTAVRGVPVRQLDAAWCRVDELTPAMLARALAVRGEPQEADEGQPRYALEGFVLDGRPVQVVLAVYGRCQGGTGTALVVLDPAAHPAARLVSAQSLAEPAHWAMLAQDGGMLVVVWCMACDNASTYRWDPRLRRFDQLPDPEEDVDG